MADKKKRVRTKKEESQAVSDDQGFLEQKETRKGREELVKTTMKNRDVVENPRLMDKHSADGRKEGKAMKKQGAGKRNWGSHKDEMKEEKEVKEEEVKEE